MIAGNLAHLQQYGELCGVFSTGPFASTRLSLAQPYISIERMERGAHRERRKLNRFFLRPGQFQALLVCDGKSSDAELWLKVVCSKLLKVEWNRTKSEVAHSPKPAHACSTWTSFLIPQRARLV